MRDGQVAGRQDRRHRIERGGGHVYRFDTRTDRLDDLGAPGATDWHSVNMTADRRLGVGSAPAGDEVVLVELTGSPARNAAVLPVHPTWGAASDRRTRSAFEWGRPRSRKSDKLAVIDLVRHAVVAYLDVAPAADAVNPANCGGCAVHGVTLRR